jgi:hypothetical protein
MYTHTETLIDGNTQMHSLLSLSKVLYRVIKMFNVEKVNLRGYKWNETVSNRICYESNRICNVSNEICNYWYISRQRQFNTLPRQ